MAYSKTTWANGDVITAAKLNNMENGIAGATPLVLTESVIAEDEVKKTYALSATWQEVHDALVSGVPVVMIYASEGDLYRSLVTTSDGTVGYSVYVGDLGYEYTASAATGYPTREENK